MKNLACALSLLLAVVIFGCSGSGGKNAVVPSDATDNMTAVQSNRHLWGIWDVSINADRTSAEVAPMRAADMHLNVVKLLEGKACTTCLQISNVKITGANELSVDLTLTHPYPGLIKYTGFDVRGIFISTADYTFPSTNRKIALGDTVPRMIDADGYTSLFNPTEFPPTVPAALGYIAGKRATGGDLSSTLNPFIAYRKDAPRRMFEAGGTETKTVKIHTPTGPIHFGYAVDVCWQLVDNVIDPVTDFPPDANCLEAYGINVDIASRLGPYAGSSVPIEVEVYDHQGQDTISTVTMEAPGLFNGEAALAFSSAMPDGGFLFTGTLSNDLGAGQGEDPLLVSVTDWENDQNLGNVKAWQITQVKVGLAEGWARTWGGGAPQSREDVFSVTTDGQGYEYVTGTFEGVTDLDPGPGIDIHTSNGQADDFLSKFDQNGNFVWARSWGGESYDLAAYVIVDAFGNIYLTGFFKGTVDFDPGAGVDSCTANGNADGYLSKLDHDGSFLWVSTWGGMGQGGVHGESIAVDGFGNPYITGEFVDTVDFDPGAEIDYHICNGSYDIFISKFDMNGNFIWARTLGGIDFDIGYSVAIDGSGNSYITGEFSDIVDFDPGDGVDNRTANGNMDAFLSKFDSNGNYMWVRTWGGGYDDEGHSAAIDSAGGIYISGMFGEGPVDFDPGDGVDNHTSNGCYDAFLSKFDMNGNFIWARTWGGINEDHPKSVAVDGAGFVYTTGFFSGDNIDFDPGAGVDNHTSLVEDIYLSKYDLNGNLIWARTWGGIGHDYGGSVAADQFGNAYVAGVFGDIVDFDPGPGVDNHTSNGASDAFLAKFPPDGNW